MLGETTRDHMSSIHYRCVHVTQSSHATKPRRHHTRPLSSVSQGDCIVVAGDFNEQLPANTVDRTGKYVGGHESVNTDKIIELMQ